MKEKYYLLIFQIIAHLSLIVSIFIFSFTDWIIVALIYFLTGCLGVSITYHRYLSHKSWNAPKWWIYIGSVFGFWGLVGSPLAWSNNHIAHHKYVDTINDPHSPIIMPWWKVQWLSMITSMDRLRFSNRNVNPFQIFLHKNYFKIHMGIMISMIILFGIHYTFVLYLVPAAVLWNMSSLINTLNHLKRFGYRNFDTKDSSTNNLITGFLAWGEGWHNNHHAYPGKADFGKKWFEFDLSYYIIRLLDSKKGI